MTTYSASISTAGAIDLLQSALPDFDDALARLRNARPEVWRGLTAAAMWHVAKLDLAACAALIDQTGHALAQLHAAHSRIEFDQSQNEMEP